MNPQNMLMSALALLGVMLLLVFLVYPFVLGFANKFVNGFRPSYGRSLGVVLLIGVAATIVQYAVGYPLYGKGMQDHFWAVSIIALVATVVIGGAILKGLVRHADGEPLSYTKAMLTALILGVVVVLIGLAMRPWAESMKGFQPGATAPAATSSAPAAASSAPAMAAPAMAAPAVAGSAAQPASTMPAMASSAPAAATSSH